MRQLARVNSIETLQSLKAGLVSFMEEGRRALGEAESDVQRTVVWLETQQLGHWTRELRRRQEKVAQAKSELYRVKLQQEGRASGIEARKLLEAAERRRVEAEEKLAGNRAWSRKLQKELVLYKGQCQMLQSALWGDLPRAIGRLDRMVGCLKAYLELGAPVTDASFAETDSGRSRPDPRPAATKYALLRLFSPAQAERDVIAAEEPLEPVELDAEDGDEEVVVIEHGLDLEPITAEDGDKIILEPGCLDETRLLIVRTRALTDGDSGWFITTIGESAAHTRLEAMTMSELRERRPDLEEILTMPPGTLCVIANDAIEALLDTDDLDIRARSEERGARSE